MYVPEMSHWAGSVCYVSAHLSVYEWILKPSDKGLGEVECGGGIGCDTKHFNKMFFGVRGG